MASGLFGPSGPTGAPMGPVGPPILRTGTVTQVTMSPSTDGLNRHISQAQVTFTDPHGNAVVTLADTEMPKPITVGMKIQLVFGVQIPQA